jgi:hypothetical protein
MAANTSAPVLGLSTRRRGRSTPLHQTSAGRGRPACDAGVTAPQELISVGAMNVVRSIGVAEFRQRERIMIAACEGEYAMQQSKNS